MTRKIKKAGILIASILIIASCGKSKKNKNIYNVNDLIRNYATKIYSLNSEVDELPNEFKDISKDSIIGGSYSFFKSGNLQLYIFYNDRKSYNYCEEYDSLGTLITQKGYPLVDYKLIKQNKDSIFFAILFFDLNKKYENIQMYTSCNDTIKKIIMYKSKIYSNMKCINVALPLKNSLLNYNLYTNVKVRDSINNTFQNFTDTFFLNK